MTSHVKSHPRAKFLWSTATLKARKPHRRWNGGGWILLPTESSWKKRKKGAGRMQLFRRAFTSRICDRHLLYPPLYIPGTVLHPFYPPATSFSSYNHHLNPHEPAALSRGQRVSVRSTDTPPPTVADPWKLREEFFFHIHQGVIVRRNLTNFQPSNLREIHPPSRSPERAFKSSKILALLEREPILSRAVSRHSSSLSTPIRHSTPLTTPRKAWSTTTTAQGPILSTHNLQFHILFPSRVRQRGVEVWGLHPDKLVSPSWSPIIFPVGSLRFLMENGGPSGNPRNCYLWYRNSRTTGL